MDYLWYMLGYSSSEGMPVKSGDSAKIRAVKRVMKKPILIKGNEENDDYSRPHPEFEMTFEPPDEELLLEVIQGLRKVTINAHKLKHPRRPRRPRTPPPPEESSSEESDTDVLTSFVPLDEHLSDAIDQLKPVVPIVHEPYAYEANTVYHDICARRWEPEV